MEIGEELDDGWLRERVVGASTSDFRCVCLKVPCSDIENTERKAGFLE